MQKKLIVLALAGLASGAAFAQTNVTIYGVIDNYLAYGSASQSCVPAAGTGLCPVNNTAGGPTALGSTTGGNQTFYGLQSGGLSGSRIGFKGEEALGNGLKAIFLYELGNIDSTTQNNNIGQSRQAYVGLNGGWGTVVAGRVYSPGYGFAEAYNPMSGSAFSSQQNISGNNGMTIVAGNDGRLNNVVGYISPNFSGFSGRIAYAFGEQTTGSNVPFAPAATPPGNTITTTTPASYDSAQGVFGLALDYANGPLAVGIAYHNLSNIGGTTNLVPTVAGGVVTNANGSADKNQWELAVGGSYDFKFMKVLASWQNLNQNNFRTYLNASNAKYNADISGLGTGVASPVATGVTPGKGSVTGNLWNIGARVPVGANGAVNLAYSYYSNSVSGRDFIPGANPATRNNDQSVSSWGADYEYSFSKRTTAYAGFNYLNNGSNTAYGYGATGGSVKPSDNNNAYLLGAGLRHTF